MDGIQIPGRIAPLIIAGGLIFLVLLAVNGLVGGFSKRTTDPQQHYEKLAQALYDEGLLPPVGDDTFLMSLAQLALKPEQLNHPQGALNLGTSVSLEDTIIGSVRGTQVYQIELIPGEYKRLKPGSMRTAFREFYRLKQNQLVPRVKGQPVPLSQSIEFIVSPGGSYYRMLPVFRDGRCTRLLVSQ